MQTWIIAFLLSLGLIASANATPSRIELTDGSVVNGAVEHFENGVYTVNSPTLGVIKIPQNRVSRISYGDQAVTPQPATPTQPSAAQIQSVKQSIMSDSSLLSLIQSLQNDPDVKAILADEDLMRAVASYDFAKLQNNEKIRRLMEKPKIKAITGKVSEKP